MNNEQRKYRILIPILSFGKAGGMRVLSQLGNCWANMGHSVEIISYFESDIPYYPVNFKIRWLVDNGEETVSNNTTYDPKNSSFRRLISIYKYLKKHSKDYDIVLANYNRTAWPVWLGSKSKNYYYIQAYEAEFASLKNVKELTKRLLARLTYCLPLHKVVNAEVYKNYKNIISEYVVPPGLDLNIYYPKNLLKNFDKDLVVGCIGRKAEWKGSNDVGEAIRILRLKGYRIRFKVAFEPVKYTEHELVFPDGDANLADFYRSLDVVVAPGHIQLGAIHYPVLEAMACNVPVITTGYYPANEKNSFIVPIKSPEKIAETIELIIKDYSVAFGKAELARQIIEEFDWGIVSNKFIAIFKENVTHESIS